jgi:hypothetical protein
MSDSEIRGADNQTGALPEVYAIKRSGGLFTLHRRDAIRTMVGVTGALVFSTGCDSKTPPPSGAASPSAPANPRAFTSGTNQFCLVSLKDYNSSLPGTGTNLFVVGHVAEDFYFREFGPSGEMTLNAHETRMDAVSSDLFLLKALVRDVERRGRFEAAEQEQFAELVSAVVSQGQRPSPSSGRRMQGSETTTTSPGRRMQNAAGAVGGSGSETSGNTPAAGRRMQSGGQEAGTGGRRTQASPSQAEAAGRRMQGVAGQFQGPNGHFRQNFGDLSIDGTLYRNVKIVGSYTDGTCKLEHAAGSSVVQSMRLSELVRMQLPAPVTQPASEVQHQATTTTPVQRGTTVTRPAPVAPSRPITPPSEPSRTYTYTYSYHYWRPN